MSSKVIGIVANHHKPNAAPLTEKIRSWLEKREVRILENASLSIDQMLQEAELIICLGGDGTILSVADHMITRSVPILGVNLGALGFLTEVKESEVFEELNVFLGGHSQIEERLMLACSVGSDRDKKERRLVALNDMVISREGLSRILSVEVRVSGEKLTSFVGDGVIVATPTGSTAYSLSAGGPVVYPTLEAIVINPICPHASALRSMVVGAKEKISIRIQARSGASKAVLTADGQENIEIDDSYIVEISRANSALKLVKSSKRSYFATLRENFKFPS